MSRFKSLAQRGLLKADITEANLKQVEEIFSDLDSEIKEQTGGLVSFLKVGPEPLAVWMNQLRPEIEMKKEGRLILKGSNNLVEVVATWEQASDGYPFTIKYQNERNDCWDEKSLVNTLGNIISTGSFWITVNKIKQRT